MSRIDNRTIDCIVSETITDLELTRAGRGDLEARAEAAGIATGVRNFIAERFGVADARDLLQGLLDSMTNSPQLPTPTKGINHGQGQRYRH